MKIAFVTMLSDDFYSGGLLSLYTLLKSTPDFNYPVIIFEWNRLSQINKNNLKRLYPNVHFKSVIYNDYPESEFDIVHRKWMYNCGYRFDIFTLSKFDKIIFFDSDIIFQENMNDLVNLNIDFGAVERPIERARQFTGKKYFNGGLLVIGKKFLSIQTKQNLIHILSQNAPKDKFVESCKWIGNEPILNRYFEPFVTLIPKKYNFCIDECTSETLKQTYNLHYIGHNKPWNSDRLDCYINRALAETSTKAYANILEKKLISFYRNKLMLIARDFPDLL